MFRSNLSAINHSINQSDHVIIRLGIEFDEYHGESMYSREKSESIIQLLNKQNILQVVQFNFSTVILL